VASDDIDTVDPASLDRFRTELIEAGFEPLQGDPRRWTGPIDPSLSELTCANTMRIVFEDGWPYVPPKLFVKGIASDHAVIDGEVCLFQPDEQAFLAWHDLQSFRTRIGSWASASGQGFRPQDALLDAHLYFRPRRFGLALVELASLGIHEDLGEARGKLYGDWDEDDRILQLTSAQAPLNGRWYFRRELPGAPPRDLAALRASLTKGQLTNFERRLKHVNDSGRSAVFLLVWKVADTPNALALAASRSAAGEIVVESIELAPTDQEILLLRAGPDVELLAQKRVVILGCGAIGSNVAARLAEAGLGKLRLVDDERLRPGNVVRHAASHSVGDYKVRATRVQIALDAPWTDVEVKQKAPWSAELLRKLITDADLAIDATGMANFAELLSRVARDADIPCVSTALYRGGSVGRVRRQAGTGDVPLTERTDERRFPLIPQGDEPVTIEIGCSALVNNASPISVAAIAATTAEVVIDFLRGELNFGEELIDVYRPLEGQPFGRIGRVLG
jgi:molybdopterin/thiamine biosynthesis adenylyltransferase